MWQQPQRVVQWLLDQGQPVTAPLDVVRVGFGQSNITTLVSDADGRQWVLREPPSDASTRTAHDIGREAGILHALASTTIPVPRVIGTGHSPCGSAFLIMEKVSGAVLEDEEDARAVPPDRRRDLGFEVADTLGRLHRLDPAAVELRSSTTPYVVRQLRRFTESWSDDGADSAHDEDWSTVRTQLAALRRPPPAPVVMHGDFRLSNLMITEGGISAVLDWELCAIGDPMADLAWLLDDWRSPADAANVMPSPTRVGGFPDRDEMVAAYHDVTGFSVDGLDYYRAFSQWRAASLLAGVLRRRRTNAMGSHAAVDFDRLDHSIAALLTSAIEHLSRCR